MTSPPVFVFLSVQRQKNLQTDLVSLRISDRRRCVATRAIRLAHHHLSCCFVHSITGIVKTTRRTMLLGSIRSIAAVAAVMAVTTFVDVSEGFTASRFTSSRCPWNGVVCRASIVADDKIDEKELVSKLRSSMVTNVNNELVSLGNVMGSEKAVVVFLRHLG